MMNQEILEILKEKKQSLAGDGFNIIGAFGSFVNGSETHESDLDLLFSVNEVFMERYQGFNYFKKIHDIKDELEQSLCIRIDLTDTEVLPYLHREYLLEGVMDV